MPDLKHCTVQVKASYEWLSFTCTNGYANDAGRLTPKFRWVRLKNWNTKMAVLMATIMLNHDILGKSICKPTFRGQQVWTCPSIFCDSSSCPWTQHVGWWCRKGVEHVVNEGFPNLDLGYEWLWVKWYMMNRLCWIHWIIINNTAFFFSEEHQQIPAVLIQLAICVSGRTRSWSICLRCTARLRREA